MQAVLSCKIFYEALGMDFIAYTSPGASLKEMDDLVKEICPTAFVYRMVTEYASQDDYEKLHITKIREFLDDVKNLEL